MKMIFSLNHDLKSSKRTRGIGTKSVLLDVTSSSLSIITRPHGVLAMDFAKTRIGSNLYAVSFSFRDRLYDVAVLSVGEM